MTRIAEKPEPQLGLDMTFDEALRRFAATVPNEVEAVIADGKQKRLMAIVETDTDQLRMKKPPEDAPADGQDPKVVERSNQKRRRERK